MNGNLSPRNNQRLRLFETYRARGSRNNNLFAVYSVKVDQDFVLPSDRQLIHWIYYLEIDHSVSSFDFVEREDDKSNCQWIVDVRQLDGQTVTHQFENEKDDSRNAQSKSDRMSNSDLFQNSKRIITDNDIRSVIKISTRWIRPIGFATCLRNHEYTNLSIQLLEYVNCHKQGSIGSMLSSFEDFQYEQAVLLGLVVRLAIKGYFYLDLTERGFGYDTPWMLYPER